MFESLTLLRALEVVLALLALTIILHCLKLFQTSTGRAISQILSASEAICLAYAAVVTIGAIGHRIAPIQQQFDLFYQLVMHCLVASTIAYAACTFYNTWKQLENLPREPAIIQNKPQ